MPARTARQLTIICDNPAKRDLIPQFFARDSATGRSQYNGMVIRNMTKQTSLYGKFACEGLSDETFRLFQAKFSEEHHQFGQGSFRCHVISTDHADPPVVIRGQPFLRVSIFESNRSAFLPGGRMNAKL